MGRSEVDPSRDLIDHQEGISLTRLCWSAFRHHAIKTISIYPRCPALPALCCPLMRVRGERLLLISKRSDRLQLPSRYPFPCKQPSSAITPFPPTSSSSLSITCLHPSLPICIKQKGGSSSEGETRLLPPPSSTAFG
ncbi:uncharacterized protein ARMOST_02496 [Armillaria ostoyae]|uniref:Uncharacterized protein n=1 Tax=Armillaria ostoyae TaxID=47428 RepID=A0A284QRW1_ARMOS|nr:uncharacterized protein ARMOST_02496 [Armillaria ostoyae]